MSNFPRVPRGLETKADAILADFQAQLLALQDSYKDGLLVEEKTQIGGNTVTVSRKCDRYFQGLCTHSTLPTDGKATAPDNVEKTKPGDQDETWIDARYLLPATMEIAVEVDVYDGPNGQGYVLVGSVQLGTAIWRKAIGFGPEARSYDWQKESERS